MTFVKTGHRAICAYWFGNRAHLSQNGKERDCQNCSRCWKCGDKHVERCHITPRMHDGPDEPANLVILCKTCHYEAPDVPDPAAMWEWIDESPVAWAEWMNEVAPIMHGLDDATEAEMADWERHVEVFMRKCGIHGGRVSWASKTWAVQQAANAVLAARDQLDAPIDPAAVPEVFARAS